MKDIHIVSLIFIVSEWKVMVPSELCFSIQADNHFMEELKMFIKTEVLRIFEGTNCSNSVYFL